MTRMRRALVIFDSRYGNTVHIAEALARGLRSVPGLDAELDFAPNVTWSKIEATNLLLVGGPTEYLRASDHIRELFSRMGGVDLHRKFAFAFDTHARSPLSGGAARYIEDALRSLGATMLEPRQSAWTELRAASGPRTLGSHREIELSAGMVEKFERIGATLGREFLLALEAQLAGPEPTGPAA